MKVPYQAMKPRIEAEGCLRRQTAVLSSGVSTDRMALSRPAAGADAFAMICSEVYLTSAEVTGCPSCHVAPSANVKAIDNPSVATFHVVANSGITSYVLLSDISVL
jgi:hypothetical protein